MIDYTEVIRRLLVSAAPLVDPDLNDEAAAAIEALVAENGSLLETNARFAKRNLADMERMFVLEQERDALRADAERYRWLRDIHNADVMVVIVNIGPECEQVHFEQLDAAIDAARKKE